MRRHRLTEGRQAIAEPLRSNLRRVLSELQSPVGVDSVFAITMYGEDAGTVSEIVMECDGAPVGGDYPAIPLPVGCELIGWAASFKALEATDDFTVTVTLSGALPESAVTSASFTLETS